MKDRHVDTKLNSIINIIKMNRQQSTDDLYLARTYYYIGAYQQVLNLTVDYKQNKTSSVENDCLMWRAYIAQQKYRVVLDGIPASQENYLQAIRKVAEYFAYPEKRTNILQYFENKFAGQFDDEHRAIWCISAGTVFYNEGMYEEALGVLSGQFELESLAMTIQCLLQMHRCDLAKKVLVKMQEKDDDATLTQLATAWINIDIGGDKLQDAYYIYQDLCDKFIVTSMLLNGQAVCHIGQQKYEEAEAALRDSVEKDPNNYDTLINLIVLSQLTEKNPEIVNRYISQIKDSHKNSSLVMELEKKEADFDRICQNYAAAVSGLELEVS